MGKKGGGLAHAARERGGGERGGSKMSGLYKEKFLWGVEAAPRLESSEGGVCQPCPITSRD